MKIVVTRVDFSRGRYCADCKDCPGSPPVGYGRTKAEAIGNLVIGLSLDKVWEKYIQAPLEVEFVPYVKSANKKVVN